MSDLNQAREWAKRRVSSNYYNAEQTQAAVDVIQSLPDQWVDVEKVRELTDRHNDLIVDFIEGMRDGVSDDSLETIQDFMDSLNAEVDLLGIPKLPTLADMTPVERKACQWMQCEVETGDGYSIGVIRRVWSTKRVDILYQSGMSLDAEYRRVTPLPDLPKLQWPRSISKEPTGASLDPQENIDASIEYIKKTASGQEPNDSETPKSSIKPEDVPDNEMWLVELRGSEWIGRRDREAAPDYPWRVTYLGGIGADIARDSQITLIHRLVPESHTLPEGMRLADHETYGRVVVSPKADEGNDYRVFYFNDSIETGAGWGYAHESELTFLGGDS